MNESFFLDAECLFIWLFFSSSPWSSSRTYNKHNTHINYGQENRRVDFIYKVKFQEEKNESFIPMGPNFCSFFIHSVSTFFHKKKIFPFFQILGYKKRIFEKNCEMRNTHTDKSWRRVSCLLFFSVLLKKINIFFSYFFSSHRSFLSHFFSSSLKKFTEKKLIIIPDFWEKKITFFVVIVMCEK